MGRGLREIVLVDAVGTVFARSGPGGPFRRTRVHDTAVDIVRELLRRTLQPRAERTGGAAG